MIRTRIAATILAGLLCHTAWAEDGVGTHDIRIVYAGPCGDARGFHYRAYDRAHASTPQSTSSSVPSSVNPKPDTPT